MTEERIKELAEAIEKELHSMLRERGYNGIRVQQFIAEHIRTVAAEAREEGIEEMRPGIEAVEGLINNSHGVDGLHLNGDIAPWDELRTGGVYMEWLGEFDHALEKLKENR